LITSYERTQIAAIQTWKIDIPQLIEDCAEILFLPPPQYLGDLLPYKEVEQLLRPEAFQAQFAADKEAFLSAKHLTLIDLKEKDLESLDKLALEVKAHSQTLEVPDRKQAPLFILMQDIPPIAGAAVRLIHQIGLCYGYDLQNQEDFRYTLQSLFSIAGHPHIISCSRLTHNSPMELRHVAIHIGIDLTFRKFMVQYPYLHNAVGTSASRWYFKDACTVAQRLFQKRWLIDNHKWL
jgi:hypothetical protein